MAISPQAFTLTGFERVDGIEHAQSWLVSAREKRPVTRIESLPRQNFEDNDLSCSELDLTDSACSD